jgi:hypothetical protein
MYDVLADCAAARLGRVSFDPTEAMIAISAGNEGRHVAIGVPMDQGASYAFLFVKLRKDQRRAHTFSTRGFAEAWLATAPPTTSPPPD